MTGQKGASEDELEWALKLGSLHDFFLSQSLHPLRLPSYLPDPYTVRRTCPHSMWFCLSLSCCPTHPVLLGKVVSVYGTDSPAWIRLMPLSVALARGNRMDDSMTLSIALCPKLPPPPYPTPVHERHGLDNVGLIVFSPPPLSRLLRLARHLTALLSLSHIDTIHEIKKPLRMLDTFSVWKRCMQTTCINTECRKHQVERVVHESC